MAWIFGRWISPVCVHRKGLRTAAILAISGMLMFSMTGCEEPSEEYEQAGHDLEQGSYEYALQGFSNCYDSGVLPARSARGAGIACLRMENYEDAIYWFTKALGTEKLEKALRRDLLYYRATAFLKSEQYDSAMADCQTLMVDYGEDPGTCFLTGAVALAMDAYDEASSNFDRAYEGSEGYEMAIRIYEQYISRGMEADGTRFLERSLENTPESAEDYCDRGRIYYYMEDYNAAAEELQRAVSEGSTDALLLLGMVYNAQHASSKARAMYIQYLDEGGSAARAYNGLALCDMEESSFDSALENIEKGKPYATTEELQSLLFDEIVVYEKMLDFDTARKKAEEYAVMFPEDAVAVKEAEFLKTRIKTTVYEEPEASGEDSSGDAGDNTSDDSGNYDESYYDENYYDSGNYDESYYDENYYDSGYYDESYYDESYYDSGY